MFERRSLKVPIVLAVTMILLLVSLLIGWILLSFFGTQGTGSSPAVYWALLTTGSAMFAFVTVGVVMYLIMSIQQIGLNRRQTNFIDSVTHELKSPIASLKLYLQTLARRNMNEAQRQDFYRQMLADTDRLDQLINHLLDTARLEQRKVIQPEEREWLNVGEVARQCSDAVSSRYSVDNQRIQLIDSGQELLARRSDLTILLRNLIDNAVKYGGSPAEVAVQIGAGNRPGWLEISVEDNGPGIPRPMRRKIFGRFVRIGNELERNRQGTGLGLFLVRSVLRPLKGRIRLDDSPLLGGARFVIQLPGGRPIEAAANSVAPGTSPAAATTSCQGGFDGGS
jgi:two-component system phosphate regulon sensor histidine kinase PhoR